MRPMLITVAVLGAGLFVYSQTLAFYGDEGFELLAVQMILAGKRPYVDFFYPHPPLYAYVAAAWMWLFGNGWRAAHALSSLSTTGCLLLAADFVRTRLPEAEWRTAGAVATALLLGLQPLVVFFGTVGQGYAVCLLLLVAAFRLTIAASERGEFGRAFLAGLSAGASAMSSLLVAPAVIVLLVWLLRRRPSGARLSTAAWFVGGAAIPALPLAWLAMRGAPQVWFDLVLYHFFYRQQGHPIHGDLVVLSRLLESPALTVLALLGIVGLLFAFGRSQWSAGRREYLSLCGWLTGTLAVSSALTRPTFHQYFTPLMPFAGMLAATGLCAIAALVLAPRHRIWLVLIVLAPLLLEPVRSAGQILDGRSRTWEHFEATAREVERVTPPHGLVWAPDVIYVAGRMAPPPGLEASFALALTLPADRAEPLHIVSLRQIDDWLRAGRFDTAYECGGPERIDALGLRRLYADAHAAGDCVLFSKRIGR